MNTKQLNAELKAQAVATLTENYGIVEGATLYTMTQYVGNVGTAYVRAYALADGAIYNVTGLVANAIGDKTHDKDGKTWIKTTGYGYSRAQHVVDGLSWVLFGIGSKLNYSEL